MIAKDKKVFRIAASFLFVAAILAVILPVLISAGYTYPCEDDFGYESGGKAYAGKYGAFFGALIGAYEYYLSWQGTYVPNFLLYYIRAFDRFGIQGIHIVLILLLLLFVVSIFFLIKTLVKDNLSALVIAFITYAVIFNSSTEYGKEFFYWYTGALTYELEFALACITLALTIMLKRVTSRKYLPPLVITASIIGFIASGGTLEVTSFHCSWLLLLLVLSYKEIPKKKYLLAPFLSSFSGALINACAKGNFTRSDATSNGLHYSIPDALRDTFSCWRYEWKQIFDYKLLIVLLIAAFIMCFVCKIKIFPDGISTRNLLLIIPAVFCIQYFTAFPVVYGYHGSALIYSRTTYTYELLVKLTLLFSTICFAQWLQEHEKVSARIPICISLIIGIVIGFRYNMYPYISNGLSYQAATELRQGDIAQLYEFRVKTLTLLDQAEPGTDVSLKLPSVPGSRVMYGMGLTSDPNCNCNHSAANYYDFTSLIIEYSDNGSFTD